MIFSHKQEHEHHEPQEHSQRTKRQVQFPNVPNAFGPDVERTEDGVPIVDRSYQISGNSRSGAQPPRRYEQIVAAQPTPESEGLRLYEGLWATGTNNYVSYTYMMQYFYEIQ